MYNVLISEDEEIIIRGIQNLIDWDRLGLNVCATAENGEEALKWYAKLRPDIIITDINMPVINGLEMLKEIRKKDKRTRVIIISGYDSFSYAQQAIPLDVEQYILKPINDRELEEVLKQAVETLKRSDREGGILHTSENSFLKYFDVMPADNIVLADIRVKKDTLAGVDVLRISEGLEKSFTSDGLICFPTDKDEILAAVPADSYSTETVRNIFEKCVEFIDMSFHARTHVAVGEPCSKRDGIAGAYKSVKELGRSVLVTGYGHVVDKSFFVGRTVENVQPDEAGFEKLVMTGDTAGIQKYIDDLFIESFDPKDVTSDAIYRLSVKLALCILRLSDEYGIGIDSDSNTLTGVVTELFKMNDIESIKEMLAQKAGMLAKSIDRSDERYSPVICEILNQIENNFDKDINLKTLASRYNMNVSYLGQLFRKEVGQHFAEYLAEARNRKAKELLLGTSKNVNDIAVEVGYANTSYFHRKFKEHFGVSPAEVRRIKRL